VVVTHASLCFFFHPAAGPYVFSLIELTSVLFTLHVLVPGEHTTTDGVRPACPGVYFTLIIADEQLEGRVGVYLGLLASLVVPGAPAALPPLGPKALFAEVKCAGMETKLLFISGIERTRSL